MNNQKNYAAIRLWTLFAWVTIAIANGSGWTAAADEFPAGEQSEIQTVAYETQTSGTITIDQIENAISELENSNEVEAELKQQTIEHFRAATKNLRAANDHDARLKTITVEAETVVQRVSELKRQLEVLAQAKPMVDSSLQLSELEQLLPTTELQLSSHKKTRQEAEAELNSRGARRKEIRSRLSAIHESLTDTNSQLKTVPSADLSALDRSFIVRLLTRRTALEKERPVLEAELAKYDAEEAANAVRLRMELATANANQSEKLIALIQQRIQTAREAAAEEAVRKARRDAISADPALKSFAEENQQLAEKSKLNADELAKTEADLKTSQDTHETLLRRFEQTTKKVDAVGLTSSIGALLRKERTTLPDVQALSAAVNQRQELINDIQYLLFEYEEQKEQMSDTEASVASILDAARQDSNRNVEMLKSAAAELLKRRSEYLDDLVRGTGQYFDSLIELDMVDRKIIQLESDYENYIDQRVLWIRSGPALKTNLAIESSDAWILSPIRWIDVGTRLARDVKQHAAIYVLLALALGFWVRQGRRLRTSITKIGEVAEKANCRSILPTLQAIAATMIIAMTWPILCLVLSWRLSEIANESMFTAGVADGLKAIGITMAALEIIRQFCRYKGVGESHFRWTPRIVSLLRRETRIAVVLLLPIAFVTAVLSSGESTHQRSDAPRLAFIAGMLIMTWLVFRLLRPAALLRDQLTAHPNGWLVKLKYLIPLSIMSIPLSLAMLAATGYFFTAESLLWRLLATCLFIATLVMVRAVLNRMLLIRRRHLSMEQARQRAAMASSSETSGEHHPVAGIVTENKQADISTQSMQSRNLVSTAVTAAALVGLWMIWIGVLPALSMVGNYPLWGADQHPVASTAVPAMTPLAAVPTETNDASETVLPPTDSRAQSVTVSDLALAIFIVFVTFVLFRNGPGLLEMSLLQQLPLDASVRYAITTLVSYLIVMVGTIAACSTIGLQWSQIQWLATALTFGLAFGLQEMFANFVAGLIILLERPIRVGDIVTIDDVSGVVSRIRIRATSITNWDRKEYVVPNKEFITGRLLNWTLSDNVNRVVVEVGLAYGSDTEQARELLLKAANDHPMILKDPAAMATFEGFGDNSLNLVLRAFLPSLENRLQVIHELHTAIDQAFRQARIEIAFPQRDLHIRSMSTVAATALLPAADDEIQPGREAA